MKKLLVLFGLLISLTSCRYDGDILLGYSDDEVQYGKEFKNEFGSYNINTHSWDYYSSYSELAMTRADGDITITPTTQPQDISFTQWQQYLRAGVDNRLIGTHNYSLKSSGRFTINAIWYCGWYEGYRQYQFEFGIKVGNSLYKLFGTLGLTGTPVNYTITGCPWAVNPGTAMDVTIPTGTDFTFYMKYVKDGKQYFVESNTGNSALLYSKVENGDEVMIIAFEDNPSSTWNVNVPDFNDVVLYIQGHPELPVLEVKRFFCEDLGSAKSDFDYNDIVFDVHPLDNETEVTVRALGGTLPIKLYVGGVCVGGDDLHNIMKTGHKPANTGYILNVPAYQTTIPVKIKDLSNFTDVYALVGTEAKRIPFRTNSVGPAIIAVPVKTKWMVEFTNIILGYPEFYSDKWYDTYNEEYLIIK